MTDTEAALIVAAHVADGHDAHRSVVDDALMVLAAEVRELREVVACFADDDPCWFDHHGGCQAHGFLSLEPGVLCPVARARLAVGLEPLTR